MLGLMKRIVSLSLMAVASLAAQQYTRGVGVYPGNPKDYFGPLMRLDAESYRNLALHRPAYHSSAYDYNLTAQLVTDGIKDTRLPRWLASATSQQGALKKNERERLHGPQPDDGRGAERGGRLGPDRDGWPRRRARSGSRGRAGAVQAGSPQPGWKCVLSGSDDGAAWKELGARGRGTESPRRGDFKASVLLTAPSHRHFYRVEVEATGALVWRVGEVALFDKNRRLEIGGPYDFTSAWMSEGSGEEWVYVDLGAPCEFDRVALYWIRRAAEGVIEVSDDAAAWRALQALPATTEPVDDHQAGATGQGRYVRVRMTRPATPEGYILSEMEVWGRGGPVAGPAPGARHTGRWAPGPGRRRLADPARFAGSGGRRGALPPGLRRPRLAGGHRSGHRACELPQRRRDPEPELRRQPEHGLRLVLLRRFLVPRRVRRTGWLAGRPARG